MWERRSFWVSRNCALKCLLAAWTVNLGKEIIGAFSEVGKCGLREIALAV